MLLASMDYENEEYDSPNIISKLAYKSYTFENYGYP